MVISNSNDYLSEFMYATWEVSLELNTVIQLHNLIIFKDKNKFSKKYQNFNFQANFFFEQEGKGHESSRKFFSSSYGSSQLGSDSSLWHLLLQFIYRCHYCKACQTGVSRVSGNPHYWSWSRSKTFFLEWPSITTGLYCF